MSFVRAHSARLPSRSSSFRLLEWPYGFSRVIRFRTSPRRDGLSDGDAVGTTRRHGTSGATRPTATGRLSRLIGSNLEAPVDFQGAAQDRSGTRTAGRGTTLDEYYGATKTTSRPPRTRRADVPAWDERCGPRRVTGCSSSAFSRP